MEAETSCDICRKKSNSLNQFLNKMISDKCYYQLINTIQTKTRLGESMEPSLKKVKFVKGI
jgi:hypothetical protein